MENNNICVWVRASERLPAEAGQYFFRTTGTKFVERFNPKWEHDVRLIKEMNAEWLDECQQSAPAQIGEAEYDFLTGRNKPFFVDTFRKLLQQFDREEISMSKLVEQLNLTARNWHLEQFKGQSLSKDLEQGDKMEVLVRIVQIFSFKTYGHGDAGLAFDEWLKQDSEEGWPLVQKLLSNSQSVSDELQLLREENAKLKQRITFYEQLSKKYDNIRDCFMTYEGGSVSDLTEKLYQLSK